MAQEYSSGEILNDFNKLVQDPRFVAKIISEGTDFSITGIMKKLPDITGGQEFTGLLDAMKEKLDEGTGIVGDVVEGIWDFFTAPIALAQAGGTAMNGSVVDSPWSSVKAFNGNTGFDIRLELVCLLNDSGGTQQQQKNPYQLASQAFRMVTSPDHPAFGGSSIQNILSMAAQNLTMVSAPLDYRPYPSKGLLSLHLGKAIHTPPLFLCSEVSIKNASLLDTAGFPVLVEYEFNFVPYRMVYYEDIQQWWST